MLHSSIQYEQPFFYASKRIRIEILPYCKDCARNRLYPYTSETHQIFQLCKYRRQEIMRAHETTFSIFAFRNYKSKFSAFFTPDYSSAETLFSTRNFLGKFFSIRLFYSLLHRYSLITKDMRKAINRSGTL